MGIERTTGRTARLATVVLAMTAAAAITVRADYTIPRHTIDGGGGTSTGGAFTLTGTIGQPDTGAPAGGPFAVRGGFWPGPPAAACAADVNGNGAVDFADILAVIGAWGPCP